ncbi:hypothetical protein BH24BAC1_BH24BAC1_37060 [soil metagenome]
MQVINKKERANALWRFVGGYLLLIAVTVGLAVNSFSFREVDDKETRQVVEKMKKRDEAQAKLAQLAGMLHEIQGIKKPYAPMDPEQAGRYDRLRFDFEKGIEEMKRMYYGDTTQYNPNFQLASFLEKNYWEHDKMGLAFQKQLDEKVKEEVAKIPPPALVGGGGGGGGGGGNSAELMVLQAKLQAAQNQVQELKLQVAGSGNANKQLLQMKEKAIVVESHIDQVLTRLEEIEADCQGIEKRSDKNLDIKKRIIAKVQLLKGQAASIKSANGGLIGMN